MTSEPLLVHGGRIIDPATGTDDLLDVLFVEGVVAAVGHELQHADARRIDASGCIVTPGFVDLHCHLREPGFEHKGTIASETRAALRGGFTTVCAMPNTEPAPDTAVEVEALLDRFRKDAAVRVFPIGCVTRGRAGREIAELSELAGAGCVAFSDDGSPVANSRVMRNALSLARSLATPISEHSDDPSLSGNGAMNEGRISDRLGIPGQPAAAEITAIARNIALCELTGARLHLAHVTTARGLEMVADAKARGLPVTCEVSPSHLFLTEEAVFGPGPEPRYDTNAKINPPLRTEADRRALVAGVNSGVVDAIATDHAPHAVEDKLCEFDQAAFGISCFETAAATVLTLVERGELDLNRAIGALTSGPARTFELGRRVPALGTLSPSAPADAVVVRSTDVWEVKAGSFVSKGRNSPLEGVLLTGRVAAVVRGGSVTWLSGGTT